MLLNNEFKKILLGTDGDPQDVDLIVEDTESPVRRAELDKLYQSVQTKGHVDFGDISKSAGNVMKYSGYTSMVETLSTLKNIKNANILTTKEFLAQITTVNTAIDNLVKFGQQYRMAFAKNVIPVVLEYNTFVAACVEATTSLLYNFVDYAKNPQSKEVQPILKNTRLRGDLFYIEQLRQFNITCASGSYEKYLTAVIGRGTEYFLGIDDALLVGGAAVVSAVAISIVPVTRKIIYTFQDIRRKLTDSLTLQAYFLELNRSVVELRSDLSLDKREAILKKQDALRLKFLRLADKIRVDSRRAEELGKKTLDKDNSVLTASNIREQIDNSDIVLA